MKRYKEYRIFDDIEDVISNKFDYWDVDDKGNITYKPNPNVYIRSEDLTNENYMYHQINKERDGKYKAGCEFFYAYLEALRNAGIEEITIDVKHPSNLIKK